MDQNGFNNNNFFEGDVFIDGNTDIDGNLTVSGTYPSGGGGSVNNPMTEDLNAGNNKITNLSEITGFEGVLKTSLIDVQNNDIYHVNELRGRSDDNKLYISGNVEMTEDLNMTNKNINNVNTLDTDIITSSNSSISFNSKGISNLTFIGSPNGGADTIILNGDIRSINGHFIDGITNITGYGSGDVLQLNGDIRITNSLNLLGNNITTINNTETKGISSQTGAVAFTSTLNMFNDINMGFNDIFNVERLTASHASVSLNLDMIPATEGKAGQILARNPSYTPGNFATHKLVWTNQSAGGGVTNPMTVALDGGGFNISNVNILTVADIYTPFLHKPVGNLSIISDPLSVNTFLRCNTINPLTNPTIAMPSVDFSGVIKTNTITPYSGSEITATSLVSCSNGLNSDLIKPISNLGIIIDSKAPDGITDSKITLSAPNIIFNNSTNIAPSLVTITGNLQITNGNGYIHGNNLIVRGRNASAVPTPITIEGTTTSINSSTLNITSSTSNNFLGAVNTNFSGTVRTNFIDANSGSNISMLQNVSLGVGKFLQTSQIFTDAVRSLSNSDLLITGLLPDNKTQTNIILASPQISLNNELGPLIPDTQVNITGNIIFNNPVTNPYIQGSNLIVRGRSPANMATPITIEGTTTTINSSTLQISSTLANNINGPTNFNRNINVLSARSASIGVRTTLFKTFSAMPLVDINTLTAIKINTTIANQKGTNLIPAGGFVNGDKFIIVMYGLLSSLGSGSLNIIIAVGGTSALTFNVINTGITNQIAKFTFEIDCTVSGTNVNLSNGTSILNVERFNSSIRSSTAISTNIIDNSLASNTFDIYMYQTTAQVSTFTPLSYTIEQL